MAVARACAAHPRACLVRSARTRPRGPTGAGSGAAPARRGRGAPVARASAGPPDTGGGEEEEEEEPAAAPPSAFEELVSERLDRDSARRVLELLREVGVDPDDPEAVRAFFVRSSAVPLLFQAGGVAVNAVACYACSALVAPSLQSSSPLKPLLLALVVVTGLSFAVETIGQAVSLAGAAAATAVYGANADAFVRAVKATAGDSGVKPLDSVKAAANVLRVLGQLNELRDLLKSGLGDGEDDGKDDALRSLTSYLLVEEAERLYDFDPEEYGLTEKEAIEIAKAFFRYDADNNGYLDIREVGSLAEDLDVSLDEAELDLAVDMLDVNSNGRVEFNEFVRWWVRGPGRTIRMRRPE